MSEPIAFIDLQAQRRRLGEPLNKAIQVAIEGGQWILGPQVVELERKLATFAGVKHCVSCANGTDALVLVLRAWNIGPVRRGLRAGVHVRSIRRSGRARWCFTSVRRRAGRYLQHGPGKLGSGDCAGKARWQAQAARRHASGSFRTACGLSCDPADRAARRA